MKKVAFVIGFVLLLGALIGYRVMQKQQSTAVAKARSEQVTLPTVELEPVVKRTVIPRVVITGNIRPEGEVEVFSKAAGRLLQVEAELGQKVKAGQVLAVVESTLPALQLQQAQAGLAMAQANLLNAQRNAESAEQLAKTQNIADVALVGARSGLAVATAQVAQAKAAVGLARENLSNTRITSPIDGVITRKTASVGITVSPGGGPNQLGLFQVQDISRFKLETSIDESEIGVVRVDQKVTISVDAFPGEVFEGVVAHLAPSLDPVSRRAAVEISVENSSGRLYANMFARGEVSGLEGTEALAISLPSLVKEATTPSVYVAEHDLVSLRPVTLGVSDGQYALVMNGLNEGDQVVVSGQSLLRDGVKVMVKQGTPATATN